jgi:hypothetical protein
MNNHGLDPKYLSLSEKIYTEGALDMGNQLYEGIIFLLKGSHLWSRLDTIQELTTLTLARVGDEQAVFNSWKREVDLQASLQMDLNKF